MKLVLNEIDTKELLKLFDMNETNYNLGRMYQYFFMNEARSIDTKDINILTKINKCETKEAYFQLFLKCLDIDISDYETYLDFKKFCYENIFLLKNEDFEDNPYLKNIRISSLQMKDIKISYDSYLPYEGFPLDDLNIDEGNYYQEKYSLGFFEKKYRFQSISYKNIVWMSVIPNEIITMKDDINKVHGNVLVYGLGLGYFAYMISLKEDVTKITIVENNPIIIKLFENSVLKQFKYKNKIKIVYQDAFDFEINNSEKFDFAYVDLYHGDEDGIKIYLKFKNLELRSKNYIYWLEKTLINVLRRNLITIFYEHYYQENCNYQVEKNYNDKIINRLYSLIKDKTFNSYQEIHNLLKDDSIKQLAKKMLFD